MKKQVGKWMVFCVALVAVVLALQGAAFAANLTGDANGDGIIDATDALSMIHLYVRNISKDQIYGSCDLDCNGTVDATDALYVLHLIVGNITEFPVCR